ncbi:MAG: sigma-70 family RNA polymerase sigma factor [Chitinivibrionales bacterium]|nr:sigma-70 family RNA polymerase sigma factor [Chitinivibrionales bacterium]
MSVMPSIDSNETIARYMKEIAGCKPLSAAEEQRLSREIQKGSKTALATLVKANLRFVVSVARQYQKQGVELADLINEGNMGLIRAAKKFDPNKNFKFISYAVWWIRQGILQALAHQSRITKIPSNKVLMISKIDKVKAKIEQKLLHKPDYHEIARELNTPEKTIKEIMAIANRHASLDAEVNPNGTIRHIDLLQDRSKPVDSLIFDNGLREAVRKSLSKLEEREMEIIKMYYGIDYEVQHTLDEIAASFNITRERVRQVKQKALGYLRNSKRMQHLQKEFAV